MILQIINHTPIYVWALLAFLVYRGLWASRDREIRLQKLFIIPAVMLCLSLSGTRADGVLGGGVWAVLLLGLLAGVALAWTLGRDAVIPVNRAAGTVLLRGSWMPLVLMITIFTTKYAVAVVTAMHEETRGSLSFMAAVTSLSGLFSGVFIGRLARCIAAWLQAAEPAAA